MMALSDDNCGVGYWTIVLTQLPHLFYTCSDQHIKTLANFILKALVCDTAQQQGVEPQQQGVEPQQQGVGPQQQGVEPQQQGVGLKDVVKAFLQSESFPEMRTLHEMLITRHLSGIKCKGCVSIVNVCVHAC